MICSDVCRFFGHCGPPWSRILTSEVDSVLGGASHTYLKRLKASQQRWFAQAKAVAERINERFKLQHVTALYAVVGDFNDTPYSPYVKPLVSNSKLTDVVAAHVPEEESWTYCWHSRNRVSKIDYLLGSKEFARRVAAKVASSPNKWTPHIEQGGVGYKLSASGLALDAKLVHFETDDVKAKLFKKAPESSKVSMQLDRDAEVDLDWKQNISTTV